ncbi:MAG TPA: deoxyribonuclease V [Candidatus Dormibacteraeota bacterium]|nr:deoxyribonuclease V [Candidatus Dormibacteraeota bacterium]
MKSKLSARWNVTPAQARDIQLSLRDRVERRDRMGTLRRVAGADVALDLARGQAIAGVVVYRFPAMEEIERVWQESPLEFPYIPGLLSFREMPAILAAFERVRSQPDMIFYDGHGFAHPRRFGIACHLGVALDCPTIGCAKSRLIGVPAEPPEERGGWVRLEDKGETIGAVLRTRTGVRPIYVSTGHWVSLERAVDLVLAVSGPYRIPRPTRDADHFVGEIKRKNRSQPGDGPVHPDEF